MRTADLDYEIACTPGSMPVTLSVNYEIEFMADLKGTPDRSLWVVARPLEVQAMIGKEPFAMVPYGEISSSTLREWVKARASEVTLEACGYTLEEAQAEYSEDEDEGEYLQSQIGRPI